MITRLFGLIGPLAAFWLTLVATRPAEAQTERVLYSFKGEPDGARPQAGVIMDGAGNLYGTTLSGGAFNAGTVFKLDTAGHEIVLHSFTNGSDGGSLSSGLIMDAAGNLYGTTANGGAFNAGTVFKLDTSGNLTVLHSFGSPGDGVVPVAGVIMDGAGNLYGTTASGGAFSGGTVYKLDTAGHETVLYSFGQSAASPRDSLVMDTAGNFYGTLCCGGRYGFGAVFKLDTSGNETLLYSFTDGNDGGSPMGALIMDAAGNLYGATLGGTSNTGAIWKLDMSGNLTVLSDKAGSAAALIMDKAGNLYGDGSSLVFKLDTSGNLTVLHTFSGADGSLATGPLIMDKAGNIYGTTQLGGAFGAGTVFELQIPLALTCPASSGNVGLNYSSSLVGTGGEVPYTFSISSGSLPSGLTLNPSTGAITGTPTSAAIFNFTALATDSSGIPATNTVSADCSISIAPRPVISITDLGTLGGPSSIAWAINDADQVVGQSTTPTSGCSLPGDCGHAFLYSGGVMTDLGPQGGAFGVAQGINNAGQIVGSAVPAGSPDEHAFLWSGGVMTDLGTFGGPVSVAKAINDAGQIAGFAYIQTNVPGGYEHAFLDSGGIKTDLGTLGGAQSAAYGINSGGRVVGQSQITGNVSSSSFFPGHAFLYSGGTLTDLGTLGGSTSAAFGINSSGQVAGTSQVTGDTSVSSSQAHAFLYAGGRMSDLGTLGGAFSSAAGINDFGEVVGESTTTGACSLPGDCGHAFLYSNGMTDLNSLLPSNSGWLLIVATAINNAGGIVGYGTLNGQIHAFLMTGASSKKTTPTITWPAPATITYGTALSAAQLDAAASVPGSFVYNPPAGTVLHAGASQALSVTFTPTDTIDYTSATITVQIDVNKAPLTVTANSLSIVYGSAIPMLTASYSGFLRGDTLATAVTGNPSLTTTAIATSLPGNYPIVAGLGTLSAANYNFVFVNGNLIITFTGASPASGAACNGAYNGTFSGSVTITNNQACIFVGGAINGNVQLSGGSLSLINASATGNVQITGGTFSIGPSTNIGGNVNIQNLPASVSENQICGTRIMGNVQFQYNGTPVQIGSTSPSCSGNTIGGNLQVHNNTAATAIVGNTVSSNLDDNDNSGPTAVFNNTVGGNLQCSNDTSITGGANSALRKQGQCSSF